MICFGWSVCEGTVYSEEFSSKERGHGHGCGHAHSHHCSESRSSGSGRACTNCSTNHPHRKCKTFGKECYHCDKQGHFSQFCHSKSQCEFHQKSKPEQQKFLQRFP